MEKLTCTVEVQFRQKELESPYSTSPKIKYSEGFKQASNSLLRILELRSHGITFTTEASTSSPPNDDVSSKHMIMALKEAIRDVNEGEEGHNEKTNFHDDLPQIIRNVTTLVSFGKHLAEVKKSTLMESTPSSNPRSHRDLQKMAENYIAKFDDGTGEGIKKGSKSSATKSTQISTVNGMTYFVH